MVSTLATEGICDLLAEVVPSSVTLDLPREYLFYALPDSVGAGPPLERTKSQIVPPASIFGLFFRHGSSGRFCLGRG